jgi:predicted nucleic acid-binding protein
MQGCARSPDPLAPDPRGLRYAPQGLYDIPERGDRLIAATAVALDLPLITRDPEIAQAAGVGCIWA